MAAAVSPRRRCWLLILALLLAGAYAAFRYVVLPGDRAGPLAPLDAAGQQLADALRRDVVHLAETIGERNVGRQPAALARTAAFVAEGLERAGFALERQEFDVAGTTCVNLIGERPGSGEIVVVGAHYDSVTGSPGANDNATGVAALLALARALGSVRPQRTLRLVGFTNEEPPHFQRATMGSLVYAARCRERGENVVAMLSLETMGCYFDRDGSQRYPPGIGAAFPRTGDFIAFVADLGSRGLLADVVARFRAHARFPSEAAALPRGVPGVGWSDHWAFWQHGYPALMVTDTAPFRYPQYHTRHDLPVCVDPERMARVVGGLEHVVRELARVP